MSGSPTPHDPGAPVAPGAPPELDAPRFGALDVLRVVATVWIAWRHFLEFAIRHMIAPEDPLTWLLEHETLTHWVFYSGELTIQIFMMISAFGLTLQALGREHLAYGPWLVSRARRIYPALWVSLALLVLLDLALGWGRSGWPSRALHISWPSVGWNALGLTGVGWSRPMSGAWWFIGLILSFYLAFPLFLFFARRGLSVVLLAASTLIAVASRELLGPHIAHLFLNVDSDFLGSRCMEFSFGVLLAEQVHLRRESHPLSGRISWPTTLVLTAFAVFALDAFALQRPLPPLGPVTAFLVFCALFAWCQRLPARAMRACLALGGPSLTFYLLHQNLLGATMPHLHGADPAWVLPVFALFALLLWVVSVALQPAIDRLGRAVFRPHQRRPGP